MLPDITDIVRLALVADPDTASLISRLLFNSKRDLGGLVITLDDGKWITHCIPWGSDVTITIAESVPGRVWKLSAPIPTTRCDISAADTRLSYVLLPLALVSTIIVLRRPINGLSMIMTGIRESYIEMPYDSSNVIFMATADTIRLVTPKDAVMEIMTRSTR